MTERGPSIEERLLALGAEIDEPPAPDLAAGVRSRLEREPAAAPAAPPAWRRAVAISLITLALGGGAAYAASAEVREAVRDLLGLGAVEVERAPELPPVTNHPGLDLGRPVEPASAPRAAGFVPLESSSALLRSPDAAFVRRLGDDGVISFVYRSGAGLRPLPTQASIGLVLTQVEADLDPAILKTVAPETPIEPVRVAGAAGYWIGGEHVVAFPPGGPAGVRRRTAASTLLWTRDGITLRLEAELSKRRALRLARTIR